MEDRLERLARRERPVLPSSPFSRTPSVNLDSAANPLPVPALGLDMVTETTLSAAASEPASMATSPVANSLCGSTVPRSVSLPRTLQSHSLPHPHHKGPDVLRAPTVKNGLRLMSESRSFGGHGHNPSQGHSVAMSDLCADLLITESLGEDSLAERLRSVSFANGADTASSKSANRAAQLALSNPDILYIIFQQLDAMNVIPHEFSQRRRKPMSLRHAQLIYGQNQRAIDAWERAKTECATTTEYGPSAGLHNCLRVSRSWFPVAKRVLESRMFFKDSARWRSLVISTDSASSLQMSRKPQVLILHKLGSAQQLEVERVAPVLGGSIKWLEFYTCPGLAPTVDLLKGGRLTKIVLPGCSRVTDRTLALIAEHCPDLEYLDLRACEQVSDKGLKFIARYCPSLTLLNVGRTRGGELVTYKGVKHLARQTNINTLGVAGCFIDDRALWELALNRGPHLQRLSLNNCRLLSDASVPRVISYTPNLSVLEIRGCTQITDLRPLVLFKRYREQQGQPPLIEGCEILERRLQSAMHALKQEISLRVVADCLEFVDAADDDLDFEKFRASRRAH